MLETSRVTIGAMKVVKSTVRGLHAELEVETLGKTDSGSAGVCSASESTLRLALLKSDRFF